LSKGQKKKEKKKLTKCYGIMAVGGTVVRQQGQSGWAANHGSTQSEWYLWEQGSRMTFFLPLTFSKHTAHSSSALDATLFNEGLSATTTAGFRVASTEFTISNVVASFVLGVVFCCLDMFAPSRKN
jgi:hypothetical protein